MVSIEEAEDLRRRALGAEAVEDVGVEHAEQFLDGTVGVLGDLALGEAHGLELVQLRVAELGVLQRLHVAETRLLLALHGLEGETHVRALRVHVALEARRTADVDADPVALTRLAPVVLRRQA